jgi:hypothetical protein
MNGTLKDWLIAFGLAAVLMVGLMALDGCEEKTPTPPVAVQPAGNVGPQEPTTQLEKIGAVSVATPSPASTASTSVAKSKHAKHGASAEARAYAKAYANAATVNSLVGAHVFKTGPKDATAIGVFPDKLVSARDCVSAPAG